jgi:hypothetical protein
VPNFEKKAENKRKKREARETRQRTDNLKAQERVVAKRAMYGKRGKAAPVRIIDLETGEVKKSKVAQSTLIAQAHKNKDFRRRQLLRAQEHLVLPTGVRCGYNPKYE